MGKRYSVKLISLSMESEGPDYHEVREFRVTDNITHKVIKTFYSNKDDGIGYSFISGTRNVEISDDEQFLLVTNENDEVEKIPLKS